MSARPKPISYRGFEIDAHREPSLGGDVLLYFSVFRESDQLEVTSGFSDDRDAISTHVAHMKRIVDRILDEGDPENYLDASDDDDALPDKPDASPSRGVIPTP